MQQKVSWARYLPAIQMKGIDIQILSVSILISPYWRNLYIQLPLKKYFDRYDCTPYVGNCMVKSSYSNESLKCFRTHSGGYLKLETLTSSSSSSSLYTICLEIFATFLLCLSWSCCCYFVQRIRLHAWPAYRM